MTNNNFNRSALRAAADIDLAERARIAAAKQAAMEANPLSQVPVIVQEIPDSALYDLFRGESLSAGNTATILAQALIANNLDAVAHILNVNFSGPMPPSFKQALPQLAQMHLQVLLSAAEQKATLALAAATMTATMAAIQPTDAVRWYGSDGKLESGYAATYIARKRAEMAELEKASVKLAIVDNDKADDGDEVDREAEEA